MYDGWQETEKQYQSMLLVSIFPLGVFGRKFNGNSRIPRVIEAEGGPEWRDERELGTLQGKHRIPLKPL